MGINGKKYGNPGTLPNKIFLNYQVQIRIQDLAE